MTDRKAATNSTTTYGWVERAFHWATALLILTAVILGLVANDAAYGTGEELARKATLFSLHKTIGVTIFFVALARIVWAVSQLRPKPLHGGWEGMLAAWVHWLLYGSLVIVPLLGWAEHSATTGFAPILWPFGQSLPFVPKDPGLVEVLANLHVTFVWVLIGAVALHVAGAVKHVVIDRDATLWRMLRGTEPGAVVAGGGHLLPLALACLVWAAALAVGLATVPEEGGAVPEVAANVPVAGEVAGASDAGTDGGTASDVAAVPEVANAPEMATASGSQGGEETITFGWSVESGTLAITVAQMGSAVAGEFADWDAEIAFDEAARADGTFGAVRVTVATGSLSLGSVSKEAVSPDFLSSEAFPDAVFAADIEAGEETDYVARGTLSLRGAEVPLKLPFTLDVADGVATMTGQTVLDRRDFGIGETYTDETSVGFSVTLDVDLVARRGE